MDFTKLQQQKENTFPPFFRLVIESVVESWKDEPKEGTKLLWPPGFDECQTDFQRVCMLLAFPAIRNFKFDEEPLLIKSDEESTCGALSVTLRESGNAAWRNGNTKKALIAYNKALMSAVNDEQKAFVYANRSLVLASLNMHSSALKDIERAIQHNYPADRQPRLLARRAQYLLALGRVHEAHEGFLSVKEKSAKLNSHSDALDKQIETGLHQCAKILESKIKIASSDPTKAALQHSHLDARSSISIASTRQGKCKTNNAAQSPLFEIEYGGETVGWQLVATKDIRPGELITVDKPYARRLHLCRAASHCSRCFRRTIDPVPCRRCAYVLFCSEACEEAAWKPDGSELAADAHTGSMKINWCHQFDCGQAPRLYLDDYAGWKQLRNKHVELGDSTALKTYQDRLLTLPLDDCIGGPNVAALAFTCMARTAPSVIRNLVYGAQSANEKDSPLLAFTGHRQLPHGELSANNYAAIAWLVTNSEKRSISDLWQRTVAAVYLTHCLSAGGYPLDWTENCLLDPSRPKRVTSEAALPASWAAACLLHNLQCVASNAHAFTVSRYIEPESLTDGEVKNQPQGIDLTRIEPAELGSCLYPILSLMNHSCDPNVALIFLRDGSCGVFALRPIPKRSVLYGNYGVHYATHTRTERLELLNSQYHFQCICPACIENWSQLSYGTVRVICQQCHQQFTINDVNNSAQSVESSDSCRCALSVRRRTVQRFNKLVNQDLQEKTFSIPAQYANVRFHQLKPKLLNEHLTYLTNMLDITHLGGLLLRPAVPFDWAQELFKTLLDLRYGCWYTESSKIFVSD